MACKPRELGARDLVAHLDPFSDSITGTNYAEAQHGGQVAGRYAAQLFAHSDDEVGGLIRANWDVLTHPATTYKDAETILRLEPVDLSAEQRIEWAEMRERSEPCR